MKTLVIGSTGFIGGAIARAAVDQGWQVRAMRRDPRRWGDLKDLAGRQLIEWRQANLDDPASLTEAMRGCQVVFHAAGYYPTNSRDPHGQIKMAGTQMKNLVEAFRRAGPQLLVYTSSLSTIGKPSQPGRLANEKDEYQSGTVPVLYFDIKIEMERIALSAGIPVVVICPTAVFGPGDVKPTSGVLLINVARGRMPFFVKGDNNVVDVRDVAATQLAAVSRAQTGERYIVGGENLDYYHILSIMAQETGRQPPRIGLPPTLVQAVGSAASRIGILGGDVLQAIPYWQALDCSRARNELGHSSRPFTETVRDSLDWFRNHGYLPQ